MKRLLSVIIGLCWLWAGVVFAQQPTLPSSSGAGPFLDPGNLAQPRPSPGGGGSSFPLTSNVSAANNKIQNQAAGAANGDSVVYGQSGAQLNGLSLNGNQLISLGAATLANQAIAQGQSGAQLNGLNLNSNQLTGLAAATANNQGIAYGQTGALLNGLSLNGNALTSLAALGLTPAATFPASPTTGQLAEVNTASTCAAGSAIVLGGSTLCLGQWSGTQWLPAGGASGGSSSFPLSSDVSANTHRITGFAVNTTTGDALSQGQSHLNDMATATGNYAMGSNKLTGLGAGSATNDSLAYGQSGGELNGLTGTATNGTDKLSGYSVLGRQSVTAWGAVGDNSTLATTSIQNAINAACANATAFSNATTPGVYLPNGNYKLDKPLILTCGTSNVFDLEADDRATVNLVPTFTGPAVVVAAGNLISSLNSGTITGSPLVGSSGSSLLWVGGAPFWLDIQEDLGSTTSTLLNGATGLTVRGFFSTPSTSTGETIASSSGAVDYWKGSCSTFNSNVLGGVATCTGAYAVWIDGTDHKLHGYVTTSTTGVVYVVSSGTVTTNTTLEYDLEYDGAHAQIALGGTWGSAVAATGTIVRRPDETATLGVMIGYWPHQNAVNTFNGSIFDPEIANVARQTLGTNYTQHSSVYTFDTNTMYGSLFSQKINMPNSSSPALFGADYFNGAATTTTWASIHNFGLGCCGGHYDISRLGIVGGSIGIDVADADVSLTRLSMYYQTYMSIDLSPNATFNSNVADIRGFPATQSMGQLILENGIYSANAIYTNACGQLCDYIQNGGMRDVYIAGQANTQWGIVCSQGCNLTNANMDQENGGTCAGATLEASPVYNYTSFVIDENSQISGCSSNVDPITIEGTLNFFSAPFVFSGDNFNWAGTAPAAIVHQIGGTQNTPPSLTFSGDEYNAVLAPTIPYVDGPASLHVMSGSHWIEQAKTDWPLPQTVVNAEQFTCPSCDPPTNPPTPCTHSGLMTGARARGINGQWICEPY